MSLPKLVTRRNFLHSCLWASVAAMQYAGVYETRHLELSEVQVKLLRPSSFRPFKILHLSDFHISRTLTHSFILKAVFLGLKSSPDVACITGDFVTGEPRRERLAVYAAVLQQLSRRVPTYACLGNHDGGYWARERGGFEDTSAIEEMLARANVRLLRNRAELVDINGQEVIFAGVGDLWAQDMRPITAFEVGVVGEHRTQPLPRVLLCHNPDARDELRDFNWDLMLAGHTHGGQLRFPFLGAPFAPVKDKRFAEGLHSWEDRWIYVNRGVGNLYGLRINCPPQVSVIDVKGV